MTLLSLHSLLRNRETGYCQYGSKYNNNNKTNKTASPLAFQRNVSEYLETEKELLFDPEFVSPHRKAITSMNVDPKMGRFILVGSMDATISIFDWSKWGSEGYYFAQQQRQQQEQITSTSISSSSSPSQQQQLHQRSTISSWMRFQPVARSIQVPMSRRSLDNNNPHYDSSLDVPSGHSASIRHVQWYPVDTGAFISYGNDGCVLLWDTNRMQPVLNVMPFLASSSASATGTGHSTFTTSDDAPWGTAHWQQSGGGTGGGGGGDHSLIAIGSWGDPSIKLVDIRSGASSHQLIGHSQGITTVQWSPSMPCIVASGSNDGTIRLWDIRKSGSQACITVLNREGPLHDSPTISSNHRPSVKTDYSHLRTLATQLEKTALKNRRKRRKTTTTQDDDSSFLSRLAPNNYGHVQQGGSGGRRGGVVQSHYGPVGAISFFPRNGYTLASLGRNDGELLLWDLTYGPTVMDCKFLTTSRGGGGGGATSTTSTRRQSTPPLVIDDSHRTLWVAGGLGYNSSSSSSAGSSCSQVLGYSIQDGGGGMPQQVLKGHLNQVTSLCEMKHDKYLLSGSQDGMILCWGKPRGASSPLVHKTTRQVLTADRDNW